MNDKTLIICIAVVLCALAAVLSYDIGQRSKETDCVVFGMFTVRQPGPGTHPLVYTCKRAE